MTLLHFAVGERTRLMTKFTYVTMSSYNLLDPVDVITENSAKLRQLDWLNNTDSLNSCGLITSTKFFAGVIAHFLHCFCAAHFTESMLKRFPFARHFI